jgi:hypothetical protein
VRKPPDFGAASGSGHLTHASPRCDPFPFRGGCATLSSDAGPHEPLIFVTADPDAIREGVVVYSANPRAAYQRRRRYRLRLRHTVYAPDEAGGSCRVCHQPWPCPTPFKQAEIPWGPAPPSSTSWTPDDMDQARAFVESVLVQAFDAGLNDEPTRLPAHWSGESSLLRLANHWRCQGSQGLPLTLPDAD